MKECPNRVDMQRLRKLGLSGARGRWGRELQVFKETSAKILADHKLKKQMLQRSPRAKIPK